ncbi:hypothetical protein GCM10009122_35510 [Fulvivirga kasyanovii]|uniref:Uncharacterized protein n=1 Tax=Fulvivirga kasyanovii TaxID=396812 RepID=A0ABW9RMV5_9BACT|nr:hypothetical protein [Fulvivirga kasyanovii]MTI25031.1 hypothetical protein [Fulvivirga kasyanovii]
MTKEIQPTVEPDTEKDYQFTLEYSSRQLKQYLTACMNPGTRLQPNKVDSLVQLVMSGPRGTRFNPFIGEIPQAADKVTWTLQDTEPDADDVGEPTLHYIGFYSLDPDQASVTTSSYWNDYFDLDKYSVVAPNGCLYQSSADNTNKVTIGLRKDRGELLIGYGAVFTINIGRTLYCCRIDPIANIRSGNP